MPWFIAFGNIIAWLLVAAAAVLPIGVIRLVRARRDRKLARDERYPFEVGQRAPDEGPVTLRGILRGGGAQTTVTRAAIEHTRAEKLQLEHEGERVDLDGTIHVVRGTRVRASWKARTTQVHDGDVVIVRGTAKRVTSSYREQGWTVEPDGETKPIELCADVPASRARPIPPASLAGLLLVFGILAFFGLRWFGNHQLAKYPRKDATTQRIALRWTEPAALAAMMPGTHERSLAYLYALYAGALTLDEANLDTRVEIAEKLEGRMRWILYPDNTPPDRWPTTCEAVAQELFLQSRFEAAVARGCTNTWVDVHARLALGRYDEISSDGGDARVRVLVELAGKRWNAVADAIDTPCYADLARAFGGDDDAMRGLVRTGSVDSVDCQIVKALANPGERRSALLAIESTTNMREIEREHWQLVIDDLRWAFDADPAPAVEETPEDLKAAEAELVAFGQGKASASYSPDQDRLRTSYLRRTLLATIAPDTARDVHAFRMFAAIDRGDFETARAELAAAGRPALATILEERTRAPASSDPAMRALAKERRVDVSTTFRTDPTRLVPFLHDAALYRDLARVVGDTEHVARWQGIIDRHLARFTTVEQRLVLALIAF